LERRGKLDSFARLGRSIAVSGASVETLVTVAPTQMKYEQLMIELGRACKDQDDACRAAALNALAKLAPFGDPIAVTTALVIIPLILDHA
jgi:hypothetical protein